MEVTFCTSINKTGVPKYGLEHFGSVVATQSGSIKSDFLDEFLTHISFLSPFFSSTPTTTNLLKYRPSVLDFEKNKYVCLCSFLFFINSGLLSDLFISWFSNMEMIWFQFSRKKVLSPCQQHFPVTPCKPTTDKTFQ